MGWGFGVINFFILSSSWIGGGAWREGLKKISGETAAEGGGRGGGL